MTSPQLPHPADTHLAQSKERGSVLLVALILAGVIALSLSSYIQLTTQAAKMANRSFYMDAAQNLCDSGMEVALWAMNNSNNWSGAGFTTSASNQYRGTFPSSGNYTFMGNVTGSVKIWADVTNDKQPHIVAKATITLVDGSTITKEAEAYVKQSSYFENGMVAPTISFSGNNVTVNSWNSDPDGNVSTAAIPYSSTVAAANVTVGATSLNPGALSDQNGKIYGYAASGSSDSGGGITLKQGIIGEPSYVNNAANKGTIEDGHATYDFTASFPDVTAPTAPGNYVVPTLSTGNISLPRGTDTAASDGYYYYNISDITLSGGDEMQITSGKVRIMATTATGSAVKITGGAGIEIATGASLQLYTAGDVSIAGNGILNGGNGNVTSTANQPINFQLYGTRSAAAVSSSGYQSIGISGNGYLSGVVYAPNGNVSINGGGSTGDVLGAMIGHSITMVGNTSFHYDESLPNTLVSGLFKVRKWRELVSDTDRAPYNTYLSF